MYKIAAANRDDILRRRSEYDSKQAANDATNKANGERYQKAYNAESKKLEAMLRQKLGEYAEDLSIYFNVTIFGDTWEVKVGNQESKVFDKSQALTWTYRVSLNKDGEIIKDSSSWSGLHATTFEAIDDLQRTVDVLKILNNLDWADILNAPVPSYDATAEDIPYPDIMKGSRPNFEFELFVDDLESISGDPTRAIQAKGRGKSRIFYFIERITPKFVSYVSIHDYHVSATEGSLALAYETYHSYVDRIKIEKLFNEIGSSYEVVQVSEIHK